MGKTLRLLNKQTVVSVAIGALFQAPLIAANGDEEEIPIITIGEGEEAPALPVAAPPQPLAVTPQQVEAVTPPAAVLKSALPVINKAGTPKPAPVSARPPKILLAEDFALPKEAANDEDSAKPSAVSTPQAGVSEPKAAALPAGAVNPTGLDRFCRHCLPVHWATAGLFSAFSLVHATARDYDNRYKTVYDLGELYGLDEFQYPKNINKTVSAAPSVTPLGQSLLLSAQNPAVPSAAQLLSGTPSALSLAGLNALETSALTSALIPSQLLTDFSLLPATLGSTVAQNLSSAGLGLIRSLLSSGQSLGSLFNLSSAMPAQISTNLSVPTLSALTSSQNVSALSLAPAQALSSLSLLNTALTSLAVSVPVQISTNLSVPALSGLTSLENSLSATSGSIQSATDLTLSALTAFDLFSLIPSQLSANFSVLPTLFTLSALQNMSSGAQGLSQSLTALTMSGLNSLSLSSGLPSQLAVNLSLLPSLLGLTSLTNLSSLGLGSLQALLGSSLAGLSALNLSSLLPSQLLTDFSLLPSLLGQSSLQNSLSATSGAVQAAAGTSLAALTALNLSSLLPSQLLTDFSLLPSLLGLTSLTNLSSLGLGSIQSLLWSSLAGLSALNSLSLLPSQLLTDFSLLPSLLGQSSLQNSLSATSGLTQSLALSLAALTNSLTFSSLLPLDLSLNFSVLPTLAALSLSQNLSSAGQGLSQSLTAAGLSALNSLSLSSRLPSQAAVDLSLLPSALGLASLTNTSSATSAASLALTSLGITALESLGAGSALGLSQSTLWSATLPSLALSLPAALSLSLTASLIPSALTSGALTSLSASSLTPLAALSSLGSLSLSFLLPSAAAIPTALAASSSLGSGAVNALFLLPAASSLAANLLLSSSNGILNGLSAVSLAASIPNYVITANSLESTAFLTSAFNSALPFISLPNASVALINSSVTAANLSAALSASAGISTIPYALISLGMLLPSTTSYGLANLSGLVTSFTAVIPNISFTAGSLAASEGVLVGLAITVGNFCGLLDGVVGLLGPLIGLVAGAYTAFLSFIRLTLGNSTTSVGLFNIFGIISAIPGSLSAAYGSLNISEAISLVNSIFPISLLFSIAGESVLFGIFNILSVGVFSFGWPVASSWALPIGLSLVPSLFTLGSINSLPASVSAVSTLGVLTSALVSNASVLLSLPTSMSAVINNSLLVPSSSFAMSLLTPSSLGASSYNTAATLLTLSASGMLAIQSSLTASAVIPASLSSLANLASVFGLSSTNSITALGFSSLAPSALVSGALGGGGVASLAVAVLNSAAAVSLFFFAPSLWSLAPVIGSELYSALLTPFIAALNSGIGSLIGALAVAGSLSNAANSALGSSYLTSVAGIESLTLPSLAALASAGMLNQLLSANLLSQSVPWSLSPLMLPVDSLTELALSSGYGSFILSSFPASLYGTSALFTSSSSLVLGISTAGLHLLSILSAAPSLLAFGSLIGGALGGFWAGLTVALGGSSVTSLNSVILFSGSFLPWESSQSVQMLSTGVSLLSTGVSTVQGAILISSIPLAISVINPLIYLLTYSFGFYYYLLGHAGFTFYYSLFAFISTVISPFSLYSALPLFSSALGNFSVSIVSNSLPLFAIPAFLQTALSTTLGYSGIVSALIPTSLAALSNLSSSMPSSASVPMSLVLAANNALWSLGLIPSLALAFSAPPSLAALDGSVMLPLALSGESLLPVSMTLLSAESAVQWGLMAFSTVTGLNGLMLSSLAGYFSSINPLLSSGLGVLGSFSTLSALPSLSLAPSASVTGLGALSTALSSSAALGLQSLSLLSSVPAYLTAATLSSLPLLSGSGLASLLVPSSLVPSLLSLSSLDPLISLSSLLPASLASLSLNSSVPGVSLLDSLLPSSIIPSSTVPSALTLSSLNPLSGLSLIPSTLAAAVSSNFLIPAVSILDSLLPSFLIPSSLVPSAITLSSLNPLSGLSLIPSTLGVSSLLNSLVPAISLLDSLLPSSIIPSSTVPSTISLTSLLPISGLSLIPSTLGVSSLLNSLVPAISLLDSLLPSSIIPSSTVPSAVTLSSLNPLSGLSLIPSTLGVSSLLNSLVPAISLLDSLLPSSIIPSSTIPSATSSLSLAPLSGLSLIPAVLAGSSSLNSSVPGVSLLDSLLPSSIIPSSTVPSALTLSSLNPLSGLSLIPSTVTSLIGLNLSVPVISLLDIFVPLSSLLPSSLIPSGLTLSSLNPVNSFSLIPSTASAALTSDSLIPSALLSLAAIVPASIVPSSTVPSLISESSLNPLSSFSLIPSTLALASSSDVVIPAALSSLASVVPSFTVPSSTIPSLTSITSLNPLSSFSLNPSNSGLSSSLNSFAPAITSQLSLTIPGSVIPQVISALPTVSSAMNNSLGLAYHSFGFGQTKAPKVTENHLHFVYDPRSVLDKHYSTFEYRNVNTFGDSLSDSGSGGRGSIYMADGTGQLFYNSLISIFLTGKFNIPRNQGGTNYAVSGALIRFATNPIELLSDPFSIQRSKMKQQIAQYLKDNNGTANKEDVNILWGGGNDLTAQVTNILLNPGNIIKIAGYANDGSAFNFNGGAYYMGHDLTRILADAGAENIWVNNLPHAYYTGFTTDGMLGTGLSVENTPFEFFDLTSQLNYANDSFLRDKNNRLGSLTDMNGLDYIKVNNIHSLRHRYPFLGKELAEWLYDTNVKFYAYVVDSFNNSLRQGVAQSGAAVMYMDINTLFKEIAAAPLDFGIDEILVPQCQIGKSATNCDAGDSYYHGDDGRVYMYSDWHHPSKYTHAIIAQYMISTNQAPVMVSALGRTMDSGLKAARGVLDGQLKLNRETAPLYNDKMKAFAVYAGEMVDHRSNILDKKLYTNDLNIGLTGKLTDTVDVGGMLSFGAGEVKPSSNYRYKRQATAASVIAQYATDTWFVNGLATIAHSSFKDINRTTVLGKLNRVNKGKTSGTAWQAALTAGYDYLLCDLPDMQYKLTPQLKYRFGQAEVKGYTEQESDSTAMHFSKQKTKANELELGAGFTLKTKKLLSYLELGLAKNFSAKDDRRISAGLNSAPVDFYRRVNMNKPDLSFNIRHTVTYDFRNGWQLHLGLNYSMPLNGGNKEDRKTLGFDLGVRKEL